VNNNRHNVAYNRMKDTLEPSHVPLLTPPLIWCLSTLINLWKDMEQIILEGHNYILYIKSHKHSRRYGNCLHIFLQPENDLRQVKALCRTTDHDQTDVPINVMKQIMSL